MHGGRGGPKCQGGRVDNPVNTNTFVRLTVQCPFLYNGFLPFRFGKVRYGHGFINCLASESLVFCCVVFIRNREFERRSPSVFVKQIIRKLVSSCIFIHIDNLLLKIWKKVNSVPYVSQQRGSP